MASTVNAQISSNPRTDSVLVEMSQAFKKLDRARLSQLLPQVSGHPQEAWGAYWELKARLEEASESEVQSFLNRYTGTYQEDRLRNDWLLLLGQRRDWGNFAAHYTKFRMRDDKEVQCYAVLIDHLQNSKNDNAPSNATLTSTTPTERAAIVRKNWWSIRDADDGCNLAADRMINDPNATHAQAPLMTPHDAFVKARIATEVNRKRAASNALQIVTYAGKSARNEETVLDIIRLASSNADGAAAMLNAKGGSFSNEQRNWSWGAIGKLAALNQNSNAASYFANVTKNSDLNDDTLGWKVRALLRVNSKPHWDAVAKAIDAMSVTAQKEAIWAYWRGRAYLANKELASANAMFESIASVRGFYEQLALEELGRKITVPAKPEPLSEAEKASARLNQSLQKALHAIAIGLRSEGVREWNYSTNLTNPRGTPGGMDERELLAAANLACEREVWDRCINTSERTKSFIDFEQRFPMPHQQSVIKRAKEIGLDPAYVYGLIRQESRFIMDARSGVGASGLMQVMPATARWTAKRIGLTNFSADQINDRETNIAIGTGYLKLVLDDFAGSMPLAAAAYNAGPNRPRVWRNGAVVETAIWAENVPFAETRDYVKKVLSNTTNYAAILTGQAQSLKARLGFIGPLGSDAPPVNKELP
ncbi:MAG TPA: transglycosylase SLT domain-containing protein [Burkholderiaceae bacterium]|nr:transglycosylase SLT domain-containing protein [Burkholderiaceae bacterium]